MQIDASGSLPAMLMMVYAEHGADYSCSPNLDNGED
jgi:hypothetical protein